MSLVLSGGLRADQLPFVPREFGARFLPFPMARCACSSPLFAEGVGMRRQSVGNSSPVSGHSGLHCQRHRHPEVGI
jgi:hypothetical protein